MQVAKVTVSRKPYMESLKNSRHPVFPVHESILTAIRCDVLLQDTYKGRVIDKTKMPIELSKGLQNASDQPTSSIQQQLKLLTQQELIDFVQELARTTLLKKLYPDLSVLQIIENECCSRAKDWNSAVLLLVADAFFVMQYRCSRYFSAMFREFEHRWTSMSIRKEDVVQLAMCIINGRKFPLLLVKNIEQFINSNAAEFTAGELSVICTAFFVTNTSFGNIEMMEKLADALLHSLPNGRLKVYQLGSILKALRHAHFVKLGFYEDLGNFLSSSMDLQNESTLADLSNIAFTYASLRVSCPILFARISSNAVRLIRNRTQMRVKDVGRLVWSFALLQEPLDDVVQKQLLFILRRDVHLMEQFSEAFIEALSGLAMMKMYPVDLLRQLFLTFPKQKHGMVCVATMLSAYICISIRICMYVGMYACMHACILFMV